MVRDDLEACLQAYQFAELLLGGFMQKSEKEREQALEAALKLRDDVEPRAALVTGDGVEALRTARARLEVKLSDARAVSGQA